MQLTSLAPHRDTTARWMLLVTLLMSIALAFPTVAGAAKIRLFIDPGHGGKDPGAMSGRVAEKHTNLQISMQVMKAAKRQGWSVRMSRYNDRFVPLAARSRQAAKFKSTDFVSIHSNSMGSRPRGNMTIYRDARSRALGRQIMREMGRLTTYEDLGNRRDIRGLSVLKRTKNPAVVVEVLSVSSPGERKELTNRAVQQQYAEAIVKGIARHHGVRYLPPRPPKALKKSAPAPSTPLVPNTVAEKPASKAPATFADSPFVSKQPKKTAPESRKDNRRPAEKAEKTVRASDIRKALPEKPEAAEVGWLGTLIEILSD